jgi:histidinol phosphatase-like enzyme
MSRPGLLLDRGGTINQDGGYVGSVDRVRFIDGTFGAIRRA